MQPLSVLDGRAGPTNAGRFSYTSTTVCTLAPFNGNKLTVGGDVRIIPSAGVTLGNGGLSASTFYYVYAYVNSSGQLALEGSTTGHSTDSITGVEIKTGDSSRSLVGAVYMDGSAQFVSGTTARYVISYFNRRKLGLLNTIGSNQTTTSPPWVELTSSVRASFICWSDTGAYVQTSATVFNTSAGESVYVAAGVDGTTPTGISGLHTSSTAGAYGQVSSTLTWQTPTENASHYVTMLGGATASTATFVSGYAGVSGHTFG